MEMTIRRILVLLVAVSAFGSAESAAAVGFATHVDYPTDSDPRQVALGDFNRDGALDQAVANSSDNTVSIRLGNGDGTFRPGRFDYPAGMQPYAVAVGDLNRDGKLDLGSADPGSSSVSLRLGNGDGTLGARSTVDVDQAAVAIAFADVSQDGKLDLITTNVSTNKVSVRLGNGDGTFAATRTQFSTDSGPYGLAVADVNRDGLLDLVTANQLADTVSVRIGVGRGDFAAIAISYETGDGPSAVAVDDVNGDGSPDLVTAQTNANTIGVRLGDGGYSFVAARTDHPTGLHPRAVAVVDVDHDGTNDLVSADQDADAVSVRLGLGGGAFAVTAMSVPTGAAPWSLAIGDVNRDGLADIVTANQLSATTSVLLNTSPAPPAPNYSIRTALPAGANAAAVALGDLDRNGTNDLLAVTNAATLGVWLGTGSGAFSARTDYSTSGGLGTDVAIEDLDRDGRLDVVTTERSNDRAGVRYGVGDGTFRASRFDHMTGGDPYAIVIADVNRDGNADLLTANAADSTFSVRPGAGNGTFNGTITAYATAATPESIAVDDVNRDGRPDVVTSTRAGGAVSVRLGNGDGSFATGRTDYDFPQAKSVEVGDINRDGAPDLVTANALLRRFSVRLNNGDGTFGARTDVATDEVPYALALDDLDRNGTLDVVLANGAVDTITVRSGNGDGSFGAARSFPTGASPASLAVGDLDGDGAPDLLVGSATNDVYVMRLAHDGTGPAATDDVDPAFHNAPVPVTLTATDDQSGVDKIHYTIGADPADPTTASLVYDPAAKPTLADGEKVKYFAVDRAGNAGAVQTSSAARVEGDPPATTDDVDAVWHAGSVTVTLSATDARSGVTATHYTAGADPATPDASSAVYDPASRPVLADGERIRYFSVDAAGNVEAVRTSAVAKVDTDAPTTGDDVDGAAHGGPVTVTLRAVDERSGVAATYFTKGTDPAAPTAASSLYDPAAKPVLTSGERIRYFSVDAVGNAEAPKTSRMVTVAPAETSTPAATAAPQPITKAALTFAVTGRKKQLLLNKTYVSVTAGCSGIPCAVDVRGVVRLGTRSLGRTGARHLVLATGEPSVLHIPTTKAQRRVIRAASRKRARRAKVLFTVTARGAVGPAISRTYTIGLRRNA